MRPALRAALGALLVLAAVSPAVASARSPALRVHAIFSGGQAKNFHVGQALQVTVRDAGGRKLTRTFTALAPATKVGGSRAVPTTISCQDVTLFGNYDRRRGRSHDPFEVAKKVTRVGLYNFIGPGKIFMWDYATTRAGSRRGRARRQEIPADGPCTMGGPSLQGRDGSTDQAARALNCDGAAGLGTR